MKLKSWEKEFQAKNGVQPTQVCYILWMLRRIAHKLLRWGTYGTAHPSCHTRILVESLNTSYRTRKNLYNYVCLNSIVLKCVIVVKIEYSYHSSVTLQLLAITHCKLYHRKVYFIPIDGKYNGISVNFH